VGLHARRREALARHRARLPRARARVKARARVGPPRLRATGCVQCGSPRTPPGSARPPLRVSAARAQVWSGHRGCVRLALWPLAACNVALYARLREALARRRAHLPRARSARAAAVACSFRRAARQRTASAGQGQREPARGRSRMAWPRHRCGPTACTLPPLAGLCRSRAPHAPARRSHAGRGRGAPARPGRPGRHLGADAERVVREELEVLRQELRRRRLAGRRPAPHVAGRAHLGGVRVRARALPSRFSTSTRRTTAGAVQQQPRRGGTAHALHAAWCQAHQRVLAHLLDVMPAAARGRGVKHHPSAADIQRPACASQDIRRAAPDDEVVPLARREAGERRRAVVVQRGSLPVGLQLGLRHRGTF
jgi:hypothetical protein